MIMLTGEKEMGPAIQGEGPACAQALREEAS